jgi:DNA-binding CsgD family transcriptional regulator
VDLSAFLSKIASASGETVFSRVAASASALTQQERRIPVLVASGASTKEVEASLFISPRTVPYHLRKAFIKLRISSRGRSAT